MDQYAFGKHAQMFTRITVSAVMIPVLMRIVIVLFAVMGIMTAAGFTVIIPDMEGQRPTGCHPHKTQEC